MKALPKFKFRLYVAGDAHNSTRAIANIKAICADYAEDRYEIQIIDVLREPKLALVDGIFMTPTLVKLSPLPVRRIIGTLSERQPILESMGITGEAS